MRGDNILNEIDISVFVLAYNHASTIRMTMDGILSQKTVHAYEIIVADDGSDDGTSDILREYRDKYSDRIKLFICKYNTGYPTRLVHRILSKYARGKYIATVEGDDWWIDKNKLQKQWEILEQHKEYSAVFSDVLILDENEKKTKIEGFEPYVKKENGVFTIEDFGYMEAPGMMCTCFMRNYYKSGVDIEITYKADAIMGDITIYAVLLTQGNVFQMDEQTAVYRYVKKPGGSNYNSTIIGNRYLLLKQLRYCIRIENYLIGKTKGSYKGKLIDEQIRYISNKYNWDEMWNAMKETKYKYRIGLALWYRNGAINGRSYEINDRLRGRLKHTWNEFLRDKRPVVLFGAGALATEFLDIYSWKRPVKFIVDNDTKRIGQSFKGCMIKRPEEILHFKDEVCVLVTNEKHEDEIASQLRELGIEDFYLYYSMQSRRLRNLMTNHILRVAERRHIQNYIILI